MKGNCHDCGIPYDWLHKHHLKPKSSGGTDADGIVYLCANCHEKRHGGPCGGTDRGRLTHSKEAQLKRGATMKELWSDPAYKKRQSVSRKNAWKQRDRKAQAEVMAKIWTPEKRRKHSKLLSKLQRRRIKLGLRNLKNVATKKMMSDELSRNWKTEAQ